MDWSTIGVGTTTGFSDQTEFNSFKEIAISQGSNLSFGTFEDIYSSKSFSVSSLSSAVIDYSTVSNANFKSFNKTAYSNFDWSSTSFIESLGSSSGATAISNAYKTLNYKEVDFASITGSTSTSEAFNFSAVQYNKISKSSYSDINWGNFDFQEASLSSTFKKLKFQSVDWGEVSSAQYSDIEWTTSSVSKAFNSSSFNYNSFFSSSSFSSYSSTQTNSYKGIKWQNVDYSALSVASYQNIEWSKVSLKTMQKSSTASSINYNFIDYSSLNYKKTDWSKVNYSTMNSGTYSAVDWSSVNYSKMFKSSTSAVSSSTFSSIDYSSMSFKSVNQFSKNASKKSSQFESLAYTSVSLKTASSYTSTASQTDVFDLSKNKPLKGDSLAPTIDLVNNNSTAGVLGDVILLSSKQKASVNITNFTLGSDQLTFAGVKGGVTLGSNSSGNATFSDSKGTLLATFTDITKTQMETSASFSATKGLFA
jgi:hypothetical protein